MWCHRTLQCWSYGISENPQQQKRHVFKKSLFSSSEDDLPMSTSVEPIKELSDEDFTEEQIHLIPKLPGQTSDEIKVLTWEVFEYAYKNFTDGNVRQYLENVQPWLYFIRYHKKPDCSIPILDHTGKAYIEVTNWTLQDIDTLPANTKKLCEIQSLKQDSPYQYLHTPQKLLKLINPQHHKQQNPQQNSNLFQ